MPGGGIFITLSLTILYCFYFLFGFALFNDIKFGNILKKDSYQGISALRMTGSIGTGWGLSAICMGILYKIQHWSGGGVMLSTGLVTMFVIAIISLIKFLRSKDDFYKTILIRIAIIGGLGLIFSFF
jgi:apolipoprotein N-acyltransferase